MKPGARSVLLAAVAATLLVGAGCAGDGKQYRIRDTMESLDRDLRFFGRVVDLEGSPVQGAEVSVSVRGSSALPPFFMGTSEHGAVTDADGRFRFTGARGHLLSVLEIRKEGYEWSRGSGEPKSFNYGSGSRGTLHYPDEAAPVVFHLRKRGETTFLLQGGGDCLRVEAPAEGSRRRDLVSYGGAATHHDLEYAARHIPEEGVWRVTFRCPVPGDGLLLGEAGTFQAPESGYLPEVNLDLQEDVDMHPFLLYVRSRDPVIYSRVTGDVTTRENRNGIVCRVSFQSLINPYGERTFEKEEQLSLEDYGQLRNEAQASLKKGIRPPKPDIQELLSRRRRPRVREH